MKRVLAAIAALLLFWSAAIAHEDGPGSWINNQRLTDPVTSEWCCNLHDCREEIDNIAEVEGGYLVKSTGEVIARERVIWRSPGGWWRCRYLGGPNEGKTRCIIGPPPGT